MALQCLRVFICYWTGHWLFPNYFYSKLLKGMLNSSPARWSCTPAGLTNMFALGSGTATRKLSLATPRMRLLLAYRRFRAPAFRGLTIACVITRRRQPATGVWGYKGRRHLLPPPLPVPSVFTRCLYPLSRPHSSLPPVSLPSVAWRNSSGDTR